MRRIATVATMTAAVVVASAVQALASYPPPPKPGGISGNRSTALTGANISLGVVLLAALIMIGVGALVVGTVTKRRATARP
jgi:hypothetical protein